MDSYIYIYMYTCIHRYIYAYIHIHMQQLPCHGSYCELILSLAQTSCRLSFPPALLPVVEPAALLLARCQTWSLRNLSKSTLAHDAVAAVVLHKHHLIIRVGAGLIQFVYGSHSRMAADLTLDNIFAAIFAGFSCVAHIKGTGSISGPLCEDHNRLKEDDRHHLKSWLSGSSAVWRIIPY